MRRHPKHPRVVLLDGTLYVELVPYVDASDGYPKVVLPGIEGLTQRKERLHRLLWEIFQQREVPPGLMVRHLNDDKLDLRECNLALGTHRDNMADRTRNGGDTTGERNGRAKLDEERVRQIRRRAAAGEGLPALAREYAVSKQTVAAIVSRRAWKHVGD